MNNDISWNSVHYCTLYNQKNYIFIQLGIKLKSNFLIHIHIYIYRQYNNLQVNEYLK